MNKAITVQTVVNASMEKVWECWNKPKHITGCGLLLQVTGKRRLLKTTCASAASSKPPGCQGQEHKLIEYDIDDGRHVKVEI